MQYTNTLVRYEWILPKFDFHCVFCLRCDHGLTVIIRSTSILYGLSRFQTKVNIFCSKQDNLFGMPNVYQVTSPDTLCGKRFIETSKQFKIYKWVCFIISFIVALGPSTMTSWTLKWNLKGKRFLKACGFAGCFDMQVGFSISTTCKIQLITTSMEVKTSENVI